MIDFNEEWECKVQHEFYISPEGKIVRLNGDASDWVSIHAGIAAEVTGIEDGSASDVLHELGWMVWGSKISGYRIKNAPSQAQINTVADLGFENIVQGMIKLCT